MNKNLDRDVTSYVISDVQKTLDHRMVPYDIAGTQAHVIMLAECGIVSDDVAKDILSALKDIRAEWESGKYEIDPELGAHLSLEQAIRDKAGEKAGNSTHTARSRNDQVMVTEMQFLREELLGVLEQCTRLLTVLLDRAEEHAETIFPGYTHMQPAKPTTFGHWCLALFDGVSRACDSLLHTYDKYDFCPLGSVESFGTSWDIDRKRTAELLGFSGIWEIPQDAITNRGMFQFNLLGNLSELSLVANRAATDLLLYSTDEFNYIELGESVAKQLHPVTGSSVMAQKKNPDVLELIRATAPRVSSLLQSVSGTLSGLPSGYNRDSRETKEQAVEGLEKTGSMLSSLQNVLETLQVNEKVAIDSVARNFSLTTDLADSLSQKTDIPYRTVYRVVGEAVSNLSDEGRNLRDLTVKELTDIADNLDVDLNISSEDLKLTSSPDQAISRRDHRGGQVKKEAEYLRSKRTEKRDDLNREIDSRRNNLESAEQKRSKIIKQRIS